MLSLDNAMDEAASCIAFDDRIRRMLERVRDARSTSSASRSSMAPGVELVYENGVLQPRV